MSTTRTEHSATAFITQTLHTGIDQRRPNHRLENSIFQTTWAEYLNWKNILT